jgi:hypothetical protein
MAADMAEVFAAKARELSGRWSKKIPAATYVNTIDDTRAEVITDNAAAPNAFPFQYGIRHPENWPNQVNAKHAKAWFRHMARTPKRPYMTQASKDLSTLEKASGIGMDRTIEREWDSWETKA